MLRLSSGGSEALGFHLDRMASLRGLAASLGASPATSTALALPVWALAIVAVALLWRKRALPFERRFAATAALATVTSPYLFPHDLCFLLPGVMGIGIAEGAARPADFRWAAPFLALLLLAMWMAASGLEAGWRLLPLTALAFSVRILVRSGVFAR